MKSNGNLRKTAAGFGPEETLRKAVKLAPVKKNGKEKRSFYRELEDDDDELDFTASKRESVLDYYDDEDGDEDWDQAAGDDSDEEEPGEFEWSEQDETSGFEEDFDVAEEDWEE